MIDPSMLNIIIFYEHVGRELSTVQALLAKFKENNIRARGYSCIFEYYKCLDECDGFSPTHLIVPYVYNKNSLSRYRHLLEKYPKLQVVNMHHEQIVAPFNINKAVPISSVAINDVVHVSWGQKYTNMLINAGAPAANIIQICSPRIPKKLNYKEREKLRNKLSAEFDLDSNKEWILFCEDRDWVVQDKAKMVKVLRKFGVHKLDIEEYYHHRKESLSRFLTDVNSLPDAFFVRYELIYREHPGVKGRVHLADKIKTISKYAVYDWLQCVSFNIVDGSTSCFESDSLGVKTATHQPIDGDPKFRVFGIDNYLRLNCIADILDPEIEALANDQINKMIYQEYLGDSHLDFSDIFVSRILKLEVRVHFKRDLQSKRRYFLRKWVFEKLIARLPSKYFSIITTYFGYRWLIKDRPVEF